MENILFQIKHQLYSRTLLERFESKHQHELQNGLAQLIFILVADWIKKKDFIIIILHRSSYEINYTEMKCRLI